MHGDGESSTTIYLFSVPHFEEDSFPILFTIEKRALKTNVNPV
jgi:hypothetical protein